MCWPTRTEPIWFGLDFGIVWQSGSLVVMGIHYIPSRGVAAGQYGRSCRVKR